MADPNANFVNVKLSTPAKEMKTLLGLSDQPFVWKTLSRISAESVTVLMNDVYNTTTGYPTFSKIQYGTLTRSLEDFYDRVRAANLQNYVNSSRPEVAQWFLYQRYWVRKGGKADGGATEETQTEAGDDDTQTTSEAAEQQTPSLPSTYPPGYPASSSTQASPTSASSSSYPQTSIGLPTSSLAQYSTSNITSGYDQPTPKVEGGYGPPLNYPSSSQSISSPSLAYPPPQFSSSPFSGPLHPPPFRRWESAIDPQGKQYFSCYEGGVFKFSTYTAEYANENGQRYYFNSFDGTSNWEPPPNRQYKPLNEGLG